MFWASKHLESYLDHQCVHVRSLLLVRVKRKRRPMRNRLWHKRGREPKANPPPAKRTLTSGHTKCLCCFRTAHKGFWFGIHMAFENSRPIAFVLIGKGNRRKHGRRHASDSESTGREYAPPPLMLYGRLGGYERAIMCHAMPSFCSVTASRGLSTRGIPPVSDMLPSTIACAAEARFLTTTILPL